MKNQSLESQLAVQATAMQELEQQLDAQRDVATLEETVHQLEDAIAVKENELRFLCTNVQVHLIPHPTSCLVFLSLFLSLSLTHSLSLSCACEKV